MEVQNSSPSIQIKLIQPYMSTYQVFSFLLRQFKYSDVTLASMDGVLHRAHRVVLAANCGFFSRVLSELVQSELVVYMRGVDSQDLGVVIDLLYTGRAEVSTDRFQQMEHLVEELEMGNIELENRRLQDSDCNENINPKPRDDTADPPVRMESLMSAKGNISVEKVDFGLVGGRKEAIGKKSTTMETLGKDSTGVVPVRKDTVCEFPARKDTLSVVPVRKNTVSVVPAMKDRGSVVPVKRDTMSVVPSIKDTVSVVSARKQTAGKNTPSKNRARNATIAKNSSVKSAGAIKAVGKDKDWKDDVTMKYTAEKNAATVTDVLSDPLNISIATLRRSRRVPKKTRSRNSSPTSVTLRPPRKRARSCSDGIRSRIPSFSPHIGSITDAPPRNQEEGTPANPCYNQNSLATSNIPDNLNMKSPGIPNREHTRTLYKTPTGLSYKAQPRITPLSALLPPLAHTSLQPGIPLPLSGNNSPPMTPPLSGNSNLQPKPTTLSLGPRDMTILKDLWLKHLSVIDNEDGGKTWRCCCGKEWAGIHFRWNAYSHVDAHHLKHIQHRCNLCDKIFSIHDGLKNHYKTDHDQNYRVIYKSGDSSVINGTGTTHTTDGSFSSDNLGDESNIGTEGTKKKQVTNPKKILKEKFLVQQKKKSSLEESLPGIKNFDESGDASSKEIVVEMSSDDE